MDTFYRLYATTFNPAAPGAGIASNDDFTGTLTVLPGPFGGAGVTNTATGFTGAQPSSRMLSINLTAGTQYFLITTSFRSTDYVVTTGGEAGPTGPYWAGISPGDIIPTGGVSPTPTPSASVSPASPTPTPSASASASPCAATVLYDQINNEVTGAGSDVTSQDFEAANNAFDNQGADDFVVPVGQTWNVNQVVVRGEYNTGQGPAPAFNVFFFNDAATCPGTAVAGGTFLSAPYTATSEVPPARQTFTINLPSSVVLAPGTYWVSVQVRMDFAPSPPGGQWFWGNRSVMSNSGATWQNPGGGFAVGCTAWGRRTTCLTTSVGPDQLFRLVGTNGAGGCPTPTPSASVSPGTPTPTPSASASPTCAPGLTEVFDDITTLPAAGWVQTNHSTTIGTTGWFQGNDTVFPSHSGATTSYIGANFNNTTGTNTISNWLLTPPVTLQNGATMTFWTRTTTANPFPDRLQVRMSTAGASTNVGTTATDVGDFTTLLLDIDPTYTVGTYPEVWTQQTVTITGVPAATLGRLAFRYFVENGGPTGANSNYIGIDDVPVQWALRRGNPNTKCHGIGDGVTVTILRRRMVGWSSGPACRPRAGPGQLLPGERTLLLHRRTQR